MLLGNQTQHKDQNILRLSNQSYTGESHDSDEVKDFTLMNSSEDVLLQYYKSLGIKVTSYAYPQFFQALMTGQDQQMLPEMAKKMQKKEDNNLQPVLDLQYPAMNMTMPRFVSKQDETTFLKNPVYTILLEEVNLPPKLEGHLEFIFEGSAKEKYDCGWKKNLTKWREQPNS